MSSIIQTKKFLLKNSSCYQSYTSFFGQNDQVFEHYFAILDEFEKNFQKQYSLKNGNYLKIVLEDLYKNLKTDERFIADLSKHGDAFLLHPKNMFLIKRASEIVNRLAEYVIEQQFPSTRNPRAVEFLERNHSGVQLEPLLACIKVLRIFAMINVSFAHVLANKPKFLEKMFILMLQDNKAFFKQVLCIQEALIAANSVSIKRELFPLISEVMSIMPKKWFARFSRIIAMIVLENSDKMDFRELPCEFMDNKIIRIHSFLLSIPNLVLTYVQILEHLKDIMENLISTTPENVQKTIRYLKDSNLIKDSGLNLSFLKPLFEQYQIAENVISEIFVPKFIIRFIVKKSNITEILFVLSNLLSGKRKIEVQNILTEISFLERVLNPLIDTLFHPGLELDNPDDLLNNDTIHHSNSLATIRIQLLRVIINFCDRDTPNMHSKDLFVTQEERKALYRHVMSTALKAHHVNYQESNCGDINIYIDQMTSEPNDPNNIFFTDEAMTTNAFENVQDKGLLHKIIILISKSHPNSNYRFWLASCVEAFLRGSNTMYQIFVAHTGLMYDLVEKILEKKTTKANNIQISYDLVGEIIKFNKYNVIFLDKICERYGWLKMLPYNSSLNLIDSNVFLRALLLSYEKFDMNFEKEENPLFKTEAHNFAKTSQLHSNFTKDDLMWFNLLIESVEPHIINQDNICCVNTALIMAIFAEQRGLLQRYFNSLLSPKTSKSTHEILENFSKVLTIWQRYYMSKTKDSYSLKYTTGLPFYYYQDMKDRVQTFVNESLKNLELFS